MPFRENPSLQEKKHWEPKLKFSTGWEQFTDRGEGKTWMASHGMAEEQNMRIRPMMNTRVADHTPTLTMAGGYILSPNA